MTVTLWERTTAVSSDSVRESVALLEKAFVGKPSLN